MVKALRIIGKHKQAYSKRLSSL